MPVSWACTPYCHLPVKASGRDANGNPTAPVLTSPIVMTPGKRPMPMTLRVVTVA